jgi:hypothetical protein
VTSTSAATRLVACTPEWFAMFGDVLAALARERASDDQERITISEIYRDVPPGVAGHDGPIGWTATIDGRTVIFTPSPDAAADIVLEVDYAFLCESLQEHDPSDEDANAGRKAAVAAAAAAGRFHVRGDLRRSPAVLSELHDRLAARTSRA